MADIARHPAASSSEFARFRKRLAVQLRVLHALLLREMMTRFGRDNLGFFWLMGEPLILTLGVMAIWSLKGIQEHDVGLLPFVLSGYTLLTLWRHILTRSIHCLRNNAGLMFHRNVSYMDTLIVRGLLEIGGTGLSFTVAYVYLYLFDLIDPIDDPLLLVGGWLLMAWISFGAALICAGLSEIYEIMERFVQPVLYISLPFSGAFFMVSWLPSGAREFALYVPFVHANEMFRAGLLGDRVETHWDAFYTVKCCLFLTALGFICVRMARKHIRLE